MPGKRHKKRDNKTDGQAPAIPTVDGPAVDEAAQERGTEHEGSSSGDVPAVNQATSQPKEGRTSTDFLSLPLYSASDSESGDHGSQDRGGDVTSEQRVIASAGSSGGGERAEGAGEASGHSVAEAIDAVAPLTESFETQAGQEPSLSRQFDLALRPAPTQTFDVTTESEQDSAESVEASDAGATYGTGADIHDASSTDNDGWGALDSSNNYGRGTTDMPATTEQARAREETDCETELREARDRIAQLEDELTDCKRREASREAALANMPEDEQVEYAKKLSLQEPEARDQAPQIGTSSKRFEAQRQDNSRLVQKLEDCHRERRDLDDQLVRQRKHLNNDNRVLREAGYDTSLREEIVSLGDEIRRRSDEVTSESRRADEANKRVRELERQIASTTSSEYRRPEPSK